MSFRFGGADTTCDVAVDTLRAFCDFLRWVVLVPTCPLDDDAAGDRRFLTLVTVTSNPPSLGFRAVDDDVDLDTLRGDALLLRCGREGVGLVGTDAGATGVAGTTDAGGAGASEEEDVPKKEEELSISLPACRCSMRQETTMWTQQVATTRVDTYQ